MFVVIDNPGEYIVGASKGVIKRRNIKATYDTERYNAKGIRSIKGAPGKPNPNVE